MEIYPKSHLLVINSWIVVITWIFLAVFFISIILVFIFAVGEAFIGLYAFPVLVLFGITHVILSFKLKCPNCNKLITGQGLSPTHNKARKRKYLNEWSTVVLDVLLKGNFMCFHCGTEYAVETKKNL